MSRGEYSEDWFIEMKLLLWLVYGGSLGYTAYADVAGLSKPENMTTARRLRIAGGLLLAAGVAMAMLCTFHPE